MSKRYNFIIARFWGEDECPTEKDRLCVYMIRSKEVHFGTEKEAFEAAKIISIQKGKKYKPYFIDIDQNLIKIEEL